MWSLILKEKENYMNRYINKANTQMTSIWKDTQCNKSLGKWKLKPQWHIYYTLIKMAKIIIVKTLIIDKWGEKPNHSYTDSGNIT